MTSKKSFFKLLWEDEKQRLWSIVLAFIVIILPITIAAGMNIGGNRYDEERLIQNILSTYSYENGWLYMVAVVGALICAYCGFSYLFSEKKVDFYHSLPLKRTKLFAVKYVSGVLVYLVPTVGMLLINLLVLLTGAGNVFNGAILCSMLTGALFHLLGFLLIYSTAILVMMLVGNVVVYLFVTGWIFAFASAYVGLYTAMQSSFFQTYTDLSRSVFATRLEAVRHLSPFTYYAAYLSEKLGKHGSTFSLPVFLETILFILVLTVIALLLYRRRPSEGAKKAIAFQAVKPVLRISIEIISGMSLSYVFYGIVLDSSRDVGWMVLGALIGTVLSHMFMETIYHYDIKKCFHGKLSLIVCCSVSLVFMLLMRFDAFSYDGYLPKKEKLASMGIMVDSLGYDDIDWENVRAGEDSDHFVYPYLNRKSYLDNMELTDSSVTYPFAKRCVKMAENMEKGEYAGRTYEDENYYETVYIRYTLKNGKTVYRRYDVPKNFVLQEFGAVFSSEEYKASQYSLVYNVPADIIGTVVVRKEGDEAKLSLSLSEKEELLKALKKDVTALMWTDRSSDNMCFLIDIKIAKKAGIAGEMHSGMFYSYAYEPFDWQTRTVPVYTSFKNTMEFFTKFGIEYSQMIPTENIQSMELMIDDYQFRVIEDGQEKVYRLYSEWDNEIGQTVVKATVNNEGIHLNDAISSQSEQLKPDKDLSSFSVPKEYWERLYDKCFYAEYGEYLFKSGYRGARVTIVMNADEYGYYETLEYYLKPSQDIRFLFE